MGNQNEVWGAQLKKFRMTTGLSQAKFSEELSLKIANLDATKKESLEKIGLSYDFLDNTELSRYENGKRLPRYRSRYIFLIWGLVELGGIKSIEEANDWLFLVDQSYLTESETETIFINNGINPSIPTQSFSNEGNPKQIVPSNSLTLWGIGLGILLLLLVFGFLFRGQFFGGDQPTAITESNNANIQAKAEPEQVEVAPTATEIPPTAIPTDTPTATLSPTETAVPATPTEVPPTEESQQEPAESLTALISNFDNWKSNASGEAVQNIEIKDGRMCSTILKNSIYPWELRLTLDQVPLDELTAYELSFKVESDVEGSVTVSWANDGEDGVGYLYSTQPLIAGINEIKIPFTQTVADPETTLKFWLGRSGEGVVCFEEVALNPIGTIDATAVGEPVSAASLIKKGDFSKGGLERPWWMFEEGIGAFRITVEDHQLCGQVIKPPPNLWDLTIGQHEIMMMPEGKYRLTFDVETDRDMDLLVLLKSNIHTHLDETTTIQTGSTQSLSYEFSSEIEDSATFSLRFGGQDGKICFDNIELLPIVEQ